MRKKAIRELKEKIGGEIMFSSHPHETLKKWREIFDITPKALSDFIGKSPSYISDYEGGRRMSPGINTVRMFVDAFLDIDRGRGNPVADRYLFERKHDAILAIREFTSPMEVADLLGAVEGELIVTPAVERHVMGYTVIDSLKAILNFSSADYHRVYGWSSERCLIFTDVTVGRSPMVAIRAHPMSPAAVVYHRPENIDDLAKEIARIENVYLGRCSLKLEEMLEKLEGIRV